MAIVYKHIRKDTNETFYVGIGNDISRSKSKNCRNHWWHHVVKKYGYKIEILEQGISWNEACQKEKELIKQIGRKDLGLGPLVNLTDGGEGIENPTQEIRNVLSESKIGKKNPMFGKNADELYNAKLNENEVIWIRNNFALNCRTFGFRALSKKFNVDRNTIKKIIYGESYKNFGGKIHKDKTTINNKFLKEDVLWIRENFVPYHPNFGTNALSKKYNTNPSRIWKIINHKVWRNI